MMSQIRECEHGLPYGICMKDECVQAFVSGRIGGGAELQRLDSEEFPPDADMDTILAHECQHGSDIRVCMQCANLDLMIRATITPNRTVDELFEDIDKGEFDF